MLLVAAIVGLFVLPAPWSYLGVGVAAAIEIAEIYFWLWFLGRYRVRTGAEGMVGETAVVVEACDPEGRVRAQGALWRARCAVPLEAGEEAQVAAVDGLTLEVEPRRR